MTRGGLIALVIASLGCAAAQIVWDKRGAPVLDITLARWGAPVTEYTLDGRAVPFPQFDGRTLRRVRLVPGHVRIFGIARQGGEAR